jgi:hypothetical protein
MSSEFTRREALALGVSAAAVNGQRATFSLMIRSKRQRLGLLHLR